MKKSYSVLEYVQAFSKGTVEGLLAYQQVKFEARFQTQASDNIEIEVYFDSSYEMTDFYNELKYIPAYRALYTVKHHMHKDLCLVVSGKETLFDYLGSREPNLLTVSRNLDIDFKIKFKQKYSGTSFKGSVVNGELLSRQCLVEVNNLLPELSLGMLNQIGKTGEELDLLLTRIITVPTITIL
ncbi:MAG: hypothetical protein GX038_06755 [Erysipelothrix sp.]|nr:hypothetical protein [Erysipelothrix sp.]